MIACQKSEDLGEQDIEALSRVEPAISTLTGILEGMADMVKPLFPGGSRAGTGTPETARASSSDFTANDAEIRDYLVDFGLRDEDFTVTEGSEVMISESDGEINASINVTVMYLSEAITISGSATGTLNSFMVSGNLSYSGEGQLDIENFEISLSRASAISVAAEFNLPFELTYKDDVYSGIFTGRGRLSAARGFALSFDIETEVLKNGEKLAMVKFSSGDGFQVFNNGDLVSLR